MFDFDKCPKRYRGGLARYAQYGIQPGGFLTAVLSNDLVGAINRADSYGRDNLCAIVDFIYWELPGLLWGSSERVGTWIVEQGLTHPSREEWFLRDRDKLCEIGASI